MVWEVDRFRNIIKIEFIKGMPDDILKKRMEIINEAIGWDGTMIQPCQHKISECIDGSVLLFEKPGKEVKEGKNVNDMRPVIVVRGNVLEPPSFAFIWSDLTNIAMSDFEAFRAVLTLIYRSAYLIDHKRDINGNWRYNPDPKIKECIAVLDMEVGNKTHFGTVDGLLRFIDLLGWNEDVKYHSFNGKASFTEGRYGGKDPKIGRIRTFLSCIRVPFEVSKFMVDHRKEILEGGKADFYQLFEIMQALINSRGLCVPRTKAELIGYLQPYLFDGRLKDKDAGSFALGPVQRTIV